MACHAEGRGFESRHSRHFFLSWRKRTTVAVDLIWIKEPRHGP